MIGEQRPPRGRCVAVLRSHHTEAVPFIEALLFGALNYLIRGQALLSQ